MVDVTQFADAEELRDYLRLEAHRTDGPVLERARNIHALLHSLRSDSTEIDFEEVMTPLIEEWQASNPELARDVGLMVAQASMALRRIAEALTQVVSPIIRGVERWICQNPDKFQLMIFSLEILASERLAADWRKRYEEECVIIPFDRAVRLAFGLMAFNVPYRGDQDSDERNINQMYDYELRAYQALHDSRLQELVEGARSSPLDVKALKEALRHLQEVQDPIPEELSEWAVSVVGGTLVDPKPQAGRSPYTNVVRNELIANTVEKLVDCGLTATRNEASPPKSACDAVSYALKAHGENLSYSGVVKVWVDARGENR